MGRNSDSLVANGLTEDHRSKPNGSEANGTVSNGSVAPQQVPASGRGRASRHRAAAAAAVTVAEEEEKEEDLSSATDAAGRIAPDTSDSPPVSSASDAERECDRSFLLGVCMISRYSYRCHVRTYLRRGNVCTHVSVAYYIMRV